MKLDGLNGTGWGEVTAVDTSAVKMVNEHYDAVKKRERKAALRWQEIREARRRQRIEGALTAIGGGCCVVTFLGLIALLFV